MFTLARSARAGLIFLLVIFFLLAGGQTGHRREGVEAVGGGIPAQPGAADGKSLAFTGDDGQGSFSSGGEDGPRLPVSQDGEGGVEADPEEPGSEDAFLVEVSLAAQRVRVFHYGQLVREMVASTGLPDKPTPTGHFRIQNRGEWFFSKKYQQGGKYWVSFKDWGVYLFHSVPMDARQQIIPEEAAKLGRPASHGCVRLSVEHARWFYETIPTGTPVHIH